MLAAPSASRFGQFAHVRVGQHFACGLLVGLDLVVSAVKRYYRGQVGVFAGELAVAVHVAGDFRLRQERVEFLESLVGASELVRQRRLRFVVQPVQLADQTDELVALDAAGVIERVGGGMQQLVGERMADRVEHRARVVAARQRLRPFRFRDGDAVRHCRAASGSTGTSSRPSIQCTNFPRWFR